MTSSLAIAAAPQSDLSVAPVDSKSFRSGMARLAAGVNIITSAGPSGWARIDRLGGVQEVSR